MRLRYAGACRRCAQELPVGTPAIYERATRTVRCLDCTSERAAEPEPSDGSGVAGSSARREYERRKAKREERIRARHPKLGGLILRVSDDPQSTRAWERGAVGEERLGGRLDALASDDVAVLHDRRIPRSRANIDHLVVTRGGVWVIDAKRYQGRPTLTVEGGLIRPRTEKLLVGRRDCTKLVDGVLKQVDLVKGIVEETPVVGALCFVEADWPLIGGSFVTREVKVLWPKLLAWRLADDRGETDVAALRDVLAQRLPPA